MHAHTVHIFFFSFFTQYVLEIFPCQCVEIYPILLETAVMYVYYHSSLGHLPLDE